MFIELLFKGGMFTNPIANLDAIAQVTLLLGAVAHFVMGLSGKSCDFIVSVISMIVQMTMAICFPGEAQPHSYTTSQTTILRQLPTSLSNALSYFQLDGSSTIYAACPSCNYTHRAVYNRVTTEAVYPDHCTNRILTKDGRISCGASLLEERQGSKRPRKPFVSASLQDYLSRILTDPEAERLCKESV